MAVTMRIAASLALFTAFIVGQSLAFQPKDLIRIASPRDAGDDYLPFPSYTCIDHVRGLVPIRRDVKDLLLEIVGVDRLLKKPECGVIDPAWCKNEGQFYPIPCNCHAYFQCVMGADGKLNPCPYKCKPYDLVFDPNTQVCAKEDQAPPGTCFDTPSSPEPSPSPTPTTPVPTEPSPTPTESTTTTTRSTTTTSSSTTTTSSSTGVNCEYEGQKFPYPGDCHKYYLCTEGSWNNPEDFNTTIFTCGNFVYDPNTMSCTWPEQAADNLCYYPA